LKALIQRVDSAKVKISNKTISSINSGLLIFIGIYFNDTSDDINKLYNKIINLRIFEENNKFSIRDIAGEILLVSQFTLCANTKKGNRPSFKDAMEPEKAEIIFNTIVDKFKESKLKIQTGQFGAFMDVSLKNKGPMTIMLDTKI
tara:strand:+ start:1553 stop:1987 length:435 start_codon:yes stop_codon:yes gene_type:complete